MRREWIEMEVPESMFLEKKQSPSMRREWIEISRFCENEALTNVSLHAEGVD